MVEMIVDEDEEKKRAQRVFEIPRCWGCGIVPPNPNP